MVSSGEMPDNPGAVDRDGAHSEAPDGAHSEGSSQLERKPRARPALVLGTSPQVLQHFGRAVSSAGASAGASAGSSAGADYDEVSLLPSPRLDDANEGVFASFTNSTATPLAAVIRQPSLHRRPLLPPDRIVSDPIGEAADPRANPYILASPLRQARDNIVVAKRGSPRTESAPDALGALRRPIPRASSMGTQRTPSVRLHREGAQADDRRAPAIQEEPSHISEEPKYSKSAPGSRQSTPALSAPSEPTQAAAAPAVPAAPAEPAVPENPLTAAPAEPRYAAPAPPHATPRAGTPGEDRPPVAAVTRFSDRADVYMAFDKDLHRVTFDRIKFLGKGSFSQVMLATPTLSQVRPSEQERASTMLVAVKITNLGKPASAERRQLEEALRRDITLVKELSHPNLMKILAVNVDEERALVILPYCTGGDLFDLVAKNRERLQPALVRRLFADIVSAIQYLHANHVVHRDIKLENVLIDIPAKRLLELPDPIHYPHSLAVVTDMGLARKFDPADPLLTTRCGSEDYVPPEILMGQPYDGRQTDAWALGVLLYAVLEGRLPFDAPPQAPGEVRRTRGRTVHRIARVDWSWHKCKEMPEAWQGGKEIVERCLVRRDGRMLVPEIAALPWVAGATNATATAPSSADIMSVFVDEDPVPAKQLQLLNLVTDQQPYSPARSPARSPTRSPARAEPTHPPDIPAPVL